MWCGTSSRAARRAGQRSSSPPTRIASCGHGRRLAASRRARWSDERGGGSPTPRWRRRRRRGSTAARPRRANTRTAVVVAPADPALPTVSTTTSWPACPSALLSPSTCAAAPSVAGGYSHVSIRTRTGRTLPVVAVSRFWGHEPDTFGDSSGSCGFDRGAGERVALEGAVVERRDDTWERCPPITSTLGPRRF